MSRQTFFLLTTQLYIYRYTVNKSVPIISGTNYCLAIVTRLRYLICPNAKHSARCQAGAILDPSMGETDNSVKHRMTLPNNPLKIRSLSPFNFRHSLQSLPTFNESMTFLSPVSSKIGGGLLQLPAAVAAAAKAPKIIGLRDAIREDDDE
jgi:hypothetical protein